MPAPSNESNRMPGVSTGAVQRSVLLGGATALNIERTVNDIINRAHKAGASDIHFEPYPDHLLVRARIDGNLQPIENGKVQPDQMKQVIARLKIMSSLDPNEGRLPSDGRFPMGKFDPALKEVDIRSTFIPTFFGEKAVLRLVDHSKLKLTLDELGFTQENARLFQQVLARPAGLVLHVGPQGCGKTTTAYAALKNTPRPNASIVTIEEVIEYVLPGITQIEVDRERLTYVRALEAIMRQDPDVILVAELPTEETARLAIEAANSGQLVISTVHASSASSAVGRLTDLGLPRIQLAHALAGIVCQRLVRRLCTDCRERIAPSTLIRSALSLSPQVQSVWKPQAKGCRKCGGKGFRGRVAVFEVLVATDRVREAIATGASSQQIEAIAVSEGTVPLLRDGVEKIVSGAAAVEEILRTLCGVTVDDVAAITDPAEMVTFLKLVRDQFLPTPPPAPPGTAPASVPPTAPAPVVAAPPPVVPVAPRPEVPSPYGRPPSGRYKLEEPAPAAARAPQLTNRFPGRDPSRPPSDQYRVPGADDYRTAAPAPAYGREVPPSYPAPARSSDSGPRPHDEILRSLMQTLPPDVAAGIARASGGGPPVGGAPAPPPGPPGATQRVNPNELLKQLQELQRRLRQGDPGA